MTDFTDFIPFLLRILVLYFFNFSFNFIISSFVLFGRLAGLHQLLSARKFDLFYSIRAVERGGRG